MVCGKIIILRMNFGIIFVIMYFCNIFYKIRLYISAKMVYNKIKSKQNKTKPKERGKKYVQIRL